MRKYAYAVSLRRHVVRMRRIAVGMHGFCSAHPVQQPLVYHFNTDICSRCLHGMALGDLVVRLIFSRTVTLSNEFWFEQNCPERYVCVLCCR